MRLAGRIFLVALIALGALYLVYWVLLALLGTQVPDWLLLTVSLVCAAAAGRFVWISNRSKTADSVTPTVILWAVIAGSISFLAGFIGPMIFMPEANQGPMLGIFITGPLGFALGGIAGLVYAVRKNT